MDSMSAYLIGQKNRDKELMVFDWHKAANIAKHNKNATISAGLANDWKWTGGLIFDNGEPVPSDDTYVYLASTWATPEIEVNGNREDCYIMESDSDGWDSDTYWPDSALNILATKEPIPS